MKASIVAESHRRLSPLLRTTRGQERISLATSTSLLDLISLEKFSNMPSSKSTLTLSSVWDLGLKGIIMERHQIKKVMGAPSCCAAGHC